MSNSESSKTKFFIVATITLAGSAFVAAGFIVPNVLAYAKSESPRYTVSAFNGKGTDAELDFRLAALLDNKNEAAAVGLARFYIAEGHTTEALNLLDRVGENEDGMRLRTQTLIELGKYDQAKTVVDRLIQHGNEGDILIAAAVYKLGDYGTELASLDTRLTSVGALQALSRLKAGNLPLALELRALGLPVSSSTLLVKLPPSTPRSLALGQSYLAKGDKDSLVTASDFLSTGLRIDPSDIELRTVFANVLRAQNNISEADAQEKIVLRLRQGKL